MQKDICSLLSLSWDKFEDKDGFKDNYWIEDKIGDNVKILFILESPHVAEIIKKCPAIGNTGIAMSEILFGDDTPFGELIDTKPCFGIMNICNIPMQKLDYNNYRLSADTRKYYSDFLANDAFFQEFIENIDFLRSRINSKQSDINSEFVNEKFFKQFIIYAILIDFQDRFTRFFDKSKKDKIDDSLKLIIPCGNIARAFLNKLSDDVYNSQKVIILSRRLLKRGQFKSTDELKERILKFIAFFNATLAKPFRWTYIGKPLVV